MLYVGPSTPGVAEPRSPRAGSTLSETPGPTAGKPKAPRGWGSPKIWRGGTRETEIGWELSKRVKWGGRGGWEKSKGCGEWAESAKIGEIGVEKQLDVSGRNPKHRRKETRKGAGRIRKKAKHWSLMVMSYTVS